MDVLNLAETGMLDGGLSADADQRQPLALLEVATTLRRHLYSLLDFSGTRALDLTALYAIPRWPRDRPPRRRASAASTKGVLVALGAALVVILPRVLLAAADAGMHVWVKGWLLVGRNDIANAGRVVAAPDGLGRGPLVVRAARSDPRRLDARPRVPPATPAEGAAGHRSSSPERPSRSSRSLLSR